MSWPVLFRSQVGFSFQHPPTKVRDEVLQEEHYADNAAGLKDLGERISLGAVVRIHETGISMPSHLTYRRHGAPDTSSQGPMAVFTNAAVSNVAAAGRPRQ